MEEQIIIHKDSRFKVTLERAAGVKTGDGFKIEVNSDNKESALNEAEGLYKEVARITKPPVAEIKGEG